MLCDFSFNTPGITPNEITVFCRVCGRTVSTDTFPVRAECRGNPVAGYLVKICGTCATPQPALPAKPTLPLGNWLAAAIKAVTFGRITPCAGCESRMAKLNQFGHRLGTWWKR